MKRLAIIGTKEFSQQILGQVEIAGEYDVVGYFDDLTPRGTLISGRPVLGMVCDAPALYDKGQFDYIFIAVGYTRFDLREKFYDSVKGRIPLANIIMPGAIVSEKASIGEGVFIGSGSNIGDGCTVDDNVFMWGDCIIAHDNHIGKHTYLSGRIDTAGFCSIGERCFVGVRALFSDHISVCNDAWIGIGCIVIKNIKDPGKYMSPSAKLYKIE